MLRKLALLSLAMCLLTPCAALASGKQWMTNFEEAKKKAAVENKDLLVDFSGSDWCYWCKKLDEEVFSKKEFLDYARKHFVLVLVDNPRRGATPEARALMEKYQIRGLPTVMLMFADGRPYARTGYRRGGPTAYKEHLEKLRKQRDSFQELFKSAEKTGEEAEKAMTQIIQKCLDAGLPVTWIPYAEKLVELDSDNKKGYLLQCGRELAKHYLDQEEYKKAQAVLERAIKAKPEDFLCQLYLGMVYKAQYDWEKAVTCLATAYKVRKKDTPPGQWLAALSLQANCLFNLHRFDEAKKVLQTILNSASQPQVQLSQSILKRIRERIKACQDYEKFWAEEREIRKKEQKANNNPIVELKTNKGAIKLELFEDYAPNTVANFISLIEKKFYDDTKFHRVISNFMIQGGDPNSKDDDPSNDGQGGPGYTFDDELSGDYRKHFVGSLSMANRGPNTNGSQFFITHVPTFWLNGKHTVFGRVIEGQEVVNSIQQGDLLISARVLRKRNHPYVPKVKKESN
jgi:cyclophilin family peptidyl-prolyl cis-trans isomerase/tetratricopeptide (TPR) repeat protein